MSPLSGSSVFDTAWSSSSARGRNGTTRSASGAGSSRSCSERSSWCSSLPVAGSWSAQGQISLSAAVVAPGLMVMAIILFMGAISGAHLNPAVSLAFALRGDFPWKRVPGYIIIQLVGATLACLFLLAVLGNIQHLGATLPGPGYENWQALLMEIALTAGLVSVILGTASVAQNVGAIAALGVGGYIALAGSLGGAGQRCLDEPGPLVRARPRQRRFLELLGLRRGAACRSADRGRVCLHPSWARRRPDLPRRRLRVLDEGSLAAKQKLSRDIESGQVAPPGIAADDRVISRAKAATPTARRLRGPLWGRGRFESELPFRS